jgi:hypothetical protein
MTWTDDKRTRRLTCLPLPSDLVGVDASPEVLLIPHSVADWISGSSWAAYCPSQMVVRSSKTKRLNQAELWQINTCRKVPLQVNFFR